MAGRGRLHSSFRLDLVVVLAFAFCSTYLPRVVFEGGPGGAGAAMGLCVGALMAACLVAAMVWRNDGARSPWVGRAGSIAGAAFAVVTAAGALYARPAEGALSDGARALALCVAGSGVAGVAMGSVLFSGWLWVGQVAAFFIVGAVAGGIAPTGWGAASAVPAVAAGWGGVLLALARRRWAPAIISAVPFCLGAAAIGLWWGGMPMQLLGVRGGLWGMDAGETAWAARLAAWGGLAVAVLGPTAVAAQRPAEERRWLAGLHAIALLWAAGAAALVWRALSSGAGLPAAARFSPAVWLAAGAIAGGIAVDAWPIGNISIRRSLAAGSTAAAAIVLIEEWLSPAGAWQVAAAASSLLFVAGVMLAMPIPATARAGGQLGPAHAVWLWACGSLAATSVWQLLGTLPASFWAGWAVAAGGLLAVAAACLSGYGVVLSRQTVADAASGIAEVWRGGRAGRLVLAGRRVSVYPLWLRALQLVTYLGCLPIWMVLWVGRTVVTALVATVQVTAETIGGAFTGMAQLIFGATPSGDAQRVTVDERAPLVQLRPGAQWRPPEGAVHAAGRVEKAITVVDMLSAPMLALALSIEYVIRLLTASAKRKRKARAAAAAERRVLLAEAEGVPETIGIGPAPEIAPGSMVDAEAIRRDSLLRRRRDSRWRYWLRRIGGNLLGARVQEWLRPDEAEPWDERVFRVEVVAMGGRRFELFGHVWRSPRRLGCCVTVPTIRGNSEKVLEAPLRHRDLRELLDQGAEELKRLLLRAGFRVAIQDLMKGTVVSRTVMCRSPREDLIEPHRDRQCDLKQEALAGAYRCRQPLAQDASRGATSPDACGGCNFPEVWERCASLKLEGTIGIVDHAGRLHRRAHTICRLNGEMAPLAECPKKDCFSPSVITRVIAVDAGRTR